MKRKKERNDHQEDKQEGDEQEPMSENPVNDHGLFSCPTEGCIASFTKYHFLENHLSFGKCKFVAEKTTLLDKAKLLYQLKLTEGSSNQPTMSGIAVSELEDNSNLTSSPEGWALKVSKDAVRFNNNQKSYLDQKFKIGQDTGIKADPAQVACDMRKAKNETGERRFVFKEFLTSQQIQSYFSRTASKLKRTGVDEIKEKAIGEEVAFSSLRSVVLKECELTHPIIYDNLNICDLYAKSKLKNLTVAVLRSICTYFHIEIETLPQKRKAPYLSLMSELVQSCSCTK